MFPSKLSIFFSPSFVHRFIETSSLRDTILIYLVSVRIQGVATPTLYLVDLERRSIYMEYVENAMVLKDFIDENISGKTDVGHLLRFIGRGLGALIAKLHSKHIIHGDLTTSNILLRNGPIETSDNDKSEGNEPFARVSNTVNTP